MTFINVELEKTSGLWIVAHLVEVVERVAQLHCIQICFGNNSGNQNAAREMMEVHEDRVSRLCCPLYQPRIQGCLFHLHISGGPDINELRYGHNAPCDEGAGSLLSQIFKASSP